MRVLIVEDDPELAFQLKRSLRLNNYAVDICDNGTDAVHMGKEEPYDLVILDIGIPRLSGLKVLKQWREKEIDTPVLILTARDAWHEKVEGFKAGADDYLTKPFHLQELLARIKALLRRRHGQVATAVKVGGLSLEEAHRQVVLEDGAVEQLTGTEFKLLRYFMSYPDQVLSKTRLSDHIYEYDDDHDSNVIEVYIRRLRDKIGSERIKTRRGQGYVLDTGKNSSPPKPASKSEPQS